ncbi:MAG: hypothetical protein MZV64_49030 [Ignavibacteriales bacterium]|nr:hypothetical protein [Ignavibacteriales bacterium]
MEHAREIHDECPPGGCLRCGGALQEEIRHAAARPAGDPGPERQEVHGRS